MIDRRAPSFRRNAPKRQGSALVALLTTGIALAASPTSPPGNLGILLARTSDTTAEKYNYHLPGTR